LHDALYAKVKIVVPQKTAYPRQKPPKKPLNGGVVDIWLLSIKLINIVEQGQTMEYTGDITRVKRIWALTLTPKPKFQDVHLIVIPVKPNYRYNIQPNTHKTSSQRCSSMSNTPKNIFRDNQRQPVPM